jgi:glycerol kinase
MLYNIADEVWDHEILDLFNISESILPTVQSNKDDFGTIHSDHFGIEIPIGGVIGDQQSASLGQLCVKKGMIKATYGTGCFVLINTDEKKTKSKNKLLTTIASKVDDKKQYSVEGSIFNAGTVVQWLRDEMKLFKDVSEIESLIQNSKNDITFIPAFTGLGAPYWKSDTRGTIYGITRDTSKGDIVKAALKSICFQTKDLLESLKLDLGDEIKEDMTMRVDGGMSNNNWMMQFLADILNIKVERPTNHETTVMGAAYLAGLRVGFFSNLRDIEDLWKSDRIFIPNMDEEDRQAMYSNWKKIVNNLIGL